MSIRDAKLETDVKSAKNENSKFNVHIRVSNLADMQKVEAFLKEMFPYHNEEDNYKID